MNRNKKQLRNVLFCTPKSNRVWWIRFIRLNLETFREILKYQWTILSIDQTNTETFSRVSSSCMQPFRFGSTEKKNGTIDRVNEQIEKGKKERGRNVTILNRKSQTNSHTWHSMLSDCSSATKNHINTISKQFNFNGIKCAT